MFCQKWPGHAEGTCRFFCSNWKRLAGFLCLSKIRQPQQKKGGQNLGKRFKNSKNIMFQKAILWINNHEPHLAGFFHLRSPVFGRFGFNFYFGQVPTCGNLSWWPSTPPQKGVEVLKQIRNHRFGPWNWKNLEIRYYLSLRYIVFVIYLFTDISKCITTLVWFFVRDLETTCNWIWLLHGKCVYMHTYILL